MKQVKMINNKCRKDAGGTNRIDHMAKIEHKGSNCILQNSLGIRLRKESSFELQTQFQVVSLK